MKELKNKLDDVRQTCTKNAGDIKKMEAAVEKLSAEVQQQAKKVEKAAESGKDVIYKELRERETRRLNVVMYGIGEAAEGATGRERWDWDIKSCTNLFTALNASLTKDCLKFCQRVEGVGRDPRPLVVGFHEERDRARLLRLNTRGIVLNYVEICPDLTKKQRREETGPQDEVVRRNINLSKDDRAKNLVWPIMGRRGKKTGEEMCRERSGADEDSARTRADCPQTQPQRCCTCTGGSVGEPDLAGTRQMRRRGLVQ
jgi:hypothetical protein